MALKQPGMHKGRRKEGFLNKLQTCISWMLGGMVTRTQMSVVRIFQASFRTHCIKHDIAAIRVVNVYAR
jgi:hypothetical protein